ncbi:MAG: alpha/beta hydrolase [Hyphomicrobiales bacterium]
MTQLQSPLQDPEYLQVDHDSGACQIAFRHRSISANSMPGLFWLGGFKSDMDGSKALALDDYAVKKNISCTRFDYSGHGLSSGEFVDGTISKWLDEAVAVIRATSNDNDRRILVGSSMGGWLALLLNKRLKSNTGPKVHGIVLIAPAVDMTADLMWDKLPEEARAEMVQTGRFEKPSEYSDEPYILTHDLIEDGKAHLFGGGVIELSCPVHILQGGRDTDVPSSHTLKLAAQLALDDVVISMIPDGDHRLSRPEDLDRLTASIETLLENN